MGVGLVARHRRSAHVTRGKISCLFHILALGGHQQTIGFSCFWLIFLKNKIRVKDAISREKEETFSHICRGFLSAAVTSLSISV
jgi:hypothetical protein